MQLFKFMFSIFIASWFLVSTPDVSYAGSLLQDLENALMCKCDDKCGKVLINCTCSTSDKTRVKFSKMLESGLTVEQIIKSQVDEYGETVLSAPTKFGFNLTAWVMPFIALIAGGVGVRKIISSWVGKKDKDESQNEAEEKSTPGKYSKRLQDELDGIEL
ncbi:MAG: cytochrome c-type biogenesis protein CcmH [Nitrospinae bacterium]|nr:cytochrome c-type biogenesis protein CcmH [Nitrospinota bacterium]